MRKILFFIISIAFMFSCVKNDPYREMLQAGLASEVRNDSLFLGFHFGMNKKDFYASCWDMNKQGLLVQGPSNLSVEYKLDTELSQPAFMRFYPQFDDKGDIYNMPMEFTYKAYAPWDSTTSADALILDIKKLMEEWYGPGFIELVDDDGSRRVYVKIDGNRRIRIFKRDVAYVAADIADMSSDEMKKDDEN